MMSQTNEQSIYTQDAETEAPGKGRILLTVLFFAAGIVAGSAHLFYTSDSLELLQLTGFLLLGILYAFLVQKRAKTYASAVYFGLLLLLCTGLLCYFTHAFHPGQLLVFISAFLFPCTVLESWRTFYTASFMPKPVWFYTKAIPEEAPFVYLEKKHVHLLLLMDQEAPEEYTSVVPTSLPLGLAFFYSVKSGREPDEWQPYFLDADGHSRGWVFYTKRFPFGKNYLQPHETLIENQLDSDSLIIAQCLSGDETGQELL